MSTAETTPTESATAEVRSGTKLVDKAQYGLAAFLAVVGAYVVYDATTLSDGFADQPVQPYAFPYVIGGVLLVLAALLAIATARGDVPAAEEGEDVDLTQPSDWVTVAKLVAVFLANILLIDWLGWAITGAILFVGTAHVLGSRTLIRDVAVGVALSVGTWYGFYSGLGLAIPAGILDGVL
jgi:putative tricarboxylic transport membrane protein